MLILIKLPFVIAEKADDDDDMKELEAWAS